MCTVIYHKELGFLSKNRDKGEVTREQIISTSCFSAVRSVGSDYFSMAVNRHGMAFASTAINSPEWTAAAEQGRYEEAAQIFEVENAGLESPTAALSASLNGATSLDQWVERLCRPGSSWMGYNVVLADRERALLVETHAGKTHVRILPERAVVTNHFKTLEHGPRKRDDYPSSYERLEYATERVLRTEDSEEFRNLIRPSQAEGAALIWREGHFRTVSSGIIDLRARLLLHTKSREESFARYRLRALSPNSFDLVSGTV